MLCKKQKHVYTRSEPHSTYNQQYHYTNILWIVKNMQKFTTILQLSLNIFASLESVTKMHISDKKIANYFYTRPDSLHLVTWELKVLRRVKSSALYLYYVILMIQQNLWEVPEVLMDVSNVIVLNLFDSWYAS